MGDVSLNSRTITSHNIRAESETRSVETVAGHNENFSIQDGFLVKKTTSTEGRFYQHLNHDHFGLLEFTPSCTDVQYVKHPCHGKIVPETKVTLEDLRSGFVKPIIYDIKVGTKTLSFTELRASGYKKSEILRKDFRTQLADRVSSTKKRGYRFVGSSTSHKSRLHLGVHADKMIDDMTRKLSGEDLVFVIAELDKLLIYLTTEEGRRFEIIGGSVLIVAESDPELRKNKKACSPKVKLIDFAHSNVAGSNGLILDNGFISTPHRKTTYQKGFRHGVENLADDLRAALYEKTGVIV